MMYYLYYKYYIDVCKIMFISIYTIHAINTKQPTYNDISSPPSEESAYITLIISHKDQYVKF